MTKGPCSQVNMSWSKKSRASSQLQSMLRKLPSKLTVSPFSLATRSISSTSLLQFGLSAGVMPLRCSQSKPSSSAPRSTSEKSYSAMALCLRS